MDRHRSTEQSLEADKHVCGQLTSIKAQSQLNRERIVFSASGAGIFGYPYVKKHTQPIPHSIYRI